VGPIIDQTAIALRAQSGILWQVGGWGDGPPSFDSAHWAGYDRANAGDR